jgi:hypothetical protein
MKWVIFVNRHVIALSVPPGARRPGVVPDALRQEDVVADSQRDAVPATS